MSRSWISALILTLYAAVGASVFIWGWGYPQTLNPAFLLVLFFWPFVLIYWVASWVLWLAAGVFISLFGLSVLVWVWQENVR